MVATDDSGAKCCGHDNIPVCLGREILVRDIIFSGLGGVFTMTLSHLIFGTTGGAGLVISLGVGWLATRLGIAAIDHRQAISASCTTLFGTALITAEQEQSPTGGAAEIEISMNR
ncbi:MAG: hypothetical protein K0U12_02940 [Gammaproteobacteria bacterium]|nr:hypothetical protein [Gammaproteobacteria bacterium]